MMKNKVIDLANLEEQPETKTRFVDYAVDGFFDTLEVNEDVSSEKDAMTVVVDKQDREGKSFYFNLNNISDENLKKVISIILSKGVPERYIIEVFEEIIFEKKEKLLELLDEGIEMKEETQNYLESIK